MTDDEKKKLMAKASKRRMRQVHPDHYKARNAVNNALRDGRIKKAKVCKFCGKPPRPERGYNRLQAHHHDYRRPLDVWWVHPKCHDAEHFPDSVNAEP